MSDVQYKTVVGFVIQPPKAREAGGKQIKSLSVANYRDGKIYNVALWEEKAAYKVQKGDFVAASGSFKAGTFTKEDGSEVDTLDLSANQFRFLSEPLVGAASSTDGDEW